MKYAVVLLTSICDKILSSNNCFYFVFPIGASHLILGVIFPPCCAAIIK